MKARVLKFVKVSSQFCILFFLITESTMHVVCTWAMDHKSTRQTRNDEDCARVQVSQPRRLKQVTCRKVLILFLVFQFHDMSSVQALGEEGLQRGRGQQGLLPDFLIELPILQG